MTIKLLNWIKNLRIFNFLSNKFLQIYKWSSWLTSLIYNNLKKINFLFLIWFYDHFIKIIPLWKKALFYNWILYIGSVIGITGFFFHSEFLLYDYYDASAYWYLPKNLRRGVMVFWITTFVYYTFITFFSSFYYELTRHWKLYGEATYGGYLFYYFMFKHWYYWEHELYFIEEAIGWYAFFVYFCLLCGMVGGEWEEELDEDWDDAGLHTSRIAQDRGVAYIDTPNKDDLTDEDIIMLYEMNETTRFQETLTDYFGNSFDMCEDVDDTLTHYEEWEREFFPELHVVLTPEEELTENMERLYLAMPVTMDDHVMYSIFFKWESKKNWISPEYWEILVNRYRAIYKFFMFFIRIFMFFFKYFKKFRKFLIKEKLIMEEDYLEHIILAVGPYSGYIPKLKTNSRPNMVIDLVMGNSWLRPFIFVYFIFKYIRFYVLEFFAFLAGKVKIDWAYNEVSELLEDQVRMSRAIPYTQNVEFFYKPGAYPFKDIEINKNMEILLNIWFILKTILYPWGVIIFFCLTNINTNELHLYSVWGFSIIFGIVLLGNIFNIFLQQFEPRVRFRSKRSSNLK